jgi:hypothetical protein
MVVKVPDVVGATPMTLMGAVIVAIAPAFLVILTPAFLAPHVGMFPSSASAVAGAAPATKPTVSKTTTAEVVIGFLNM